MDAWTDLSCIQVLLHQAMILYSAGSNQCLQDDCGPLSAGLETNVLLEKCFQKIAQKKHPSSQACLHSTCAEAK
jgi:hypothetical protein